MSIVIVGAYGFTNVGDEAMLNNVLHGLNSVHRNGARVVSCVNQDSVSKLHSVDPVCSISPLSLVKNLILLRRKIFTKQISVIRKMKLLVYGGGSLFTDTKGLRNIIIILLTVLMARVLRVPVIMWGVSIGPVNTKMGKMIVMLILKLSTLFIVRDKKSITIANELYPDNLNIKCGSDLLFNTDISDIKINIDTDFKVPLQVGVSLRPFPATKDTNFINKDEVLIEGVSLSCQHVLNKLDAQFSLLIFSEGNDRRDDVGILNKLKDKLPENVFTENIGGLLQYPDEKAEFIVNEMLSKIAGLDIVIGERFHSLVTSALMGVPFIAISYDQKVTELTKICGMEDYCIDFQSDIDESKLAKELNDKIEKLLDNYSQVKVMLSSNVTKIQEIAENDKKTIIAKVQSYL